MADQSRPHDDPLVKQVTEKVDARPSVDADKDEIADRAATALDDLSDRPVQTFTPLLAENRIVNEITRSDSSGTAGETAELTADDGDADER